MATYVEINNNKYPAIITGRLTDNDWDGRSSKSIKLEIPYSQVAEIFIDDISWNIVQDVEREIETVDENGEPIIEKTIEFDTYDNSEYCVAGDIIDHRDGFVTVKMGKPTAEELLAILIGG